jgi:hypothetical protein
MGPVSRDALVETPALLISMLTSPAKPAARATDSGSVMSSWTGMTPGTSIVSGRRAAAYTLAPRSTSWVANRLPNPRLVPVTNAVNWSVVKVVSFDWLELVALHKPDFVPIIP